MLPSPEAIKKRREEQLKFQKEKQSMIKQVQETLSSPGFAIIEDFMKLEGYKISNCLTNPSAVSPYSKTGDSIVNINWYNVGKELGMKFFLRSIRITRRIKMTPKFILLWQGFWAGFSYLKFWKMQWIQQHKKK